MEDFVGPSWEDSDHRLTNPELGASGSGSQRWALLLQTPSDECVVELLGEEGSQAHGPEGPRIKPKQEMRINTIRIKNVHM